jgi:hypothetical protein
MKAKEMLKRARTESLGQTLYVFTYEELKEYVLQTIAEAWVKMENPS